MKKRKITLLNLSFLYIFTIVFSVILFLDNPINVQTVEEPTLFQLMQNGSETPRLVLMMGLRELYEVENLIITSSVIESLGLELNISVFAGIDNYSIQASVDINDVNVEQELYEYITEDGINFIFYENHASTIYVFEDNGIIVIAGQAS